MYILYSYLLPFRVYSTHTHTRPVEFDDIMAMVDDSVASSYDYDDQTSSHYYSSVPDYMAENFSKAQLDEFKEAFALFDAKSSGSVSVQDIGTVVRSLGESPTANCLKIFNLF